MEQGWFHCGRCGGLFQGDPERPCPECGGNPIVDASEFAFVKAGRKSRVPLQERQGSAPVSSRGLDHSRSGGRTKGVAVFVIIWVLFLAGVVGLVAWMRSGDEVREAGDVKSIAESAEESQFITDAYNDCYLQLLEFLQASSPEARSPFVKEPVETLRLMSRAADRAPVLDGEEKPRMEFFDQFESPVGPAMQSAWIMPGGERVEVVFVQDEEDEWKIDWQNVTRYSAEPWSLFVSGNGPDEAEFRLLARRRANSTGGKGDVSRLMLLEPRAWDPSKAGLSSPEVRVDPGSDIGQQLKAAFAMRERNEGAYGTRLVEKDPKGMIRVRVLLRRSAEKDELGEWGFEIKELRACHWMHFDDLGLAEEQ